MQTRSGDNNTDNAQRYKHLGIVLNESITQTQNFYRNSKLSLPKAKPNI